ncbi:hypothetical protein GXM_05231 [Nostoc sphaeroides CCNUC1]|uniref:Uncharacterized protein n=1 Tax=Nostoc sphaeroides CCNUC1 TaxID=2653204 RepID=A0A5P8W6V9_9NOSO|nr:hypothetical protein GXM_05231 [Nostoc sphaeroides CCNUC1]
MNLLWGGQHERPSCAILFAPQLMQRAGGQGSNFFRLFPPALTIF